MTVKHTANGWSALFDGVVYDGPFGGLSFSDGNAMAVGEYNGNAPNSYSMTFGPSGDTDWQKLNGSNWNTVASASPINDGGWVLGALPSPFHIHR